MSEETKICGSEEKPAGEETMNGVTGRYDLPGNGPVDDLLQKKIRESSIKKYEAGEYLFHAGQTAACFWLIRSGRVAQYRGESCLNEMGPGRFLGMRTFMLEGKFETTAQIVEPSTIIELDLAFLKNFLTSPDAVLAFLKEQERELFRIVEAGKKREVLLAGLRQKVASLERQIKGGGDSVSGSAGRTEAILRLIRPGVTQASDDLDALARDEPNLWKSLQENETFLRLFLAVKDVAGYLGSADFSSRSSRHQ